MTNTDINTSQTDSVTAAVTTATTLIGTWDRDDKSHETRSTILISEYAETALPLVEADRKVMKRTAWDTIVEEYTDRATRKGWGKVRLPIGKGTFSDSCGRVLNIVRLVGCDDDGTVVPGQALAFCANLVDTGICSWELGQLTTAVRNSFEGVSAADMRHDPDADDDTDADDVDVVAEREPASLLDVTLANLPNLSDADLSSVIGLAQQLLETRNADSDADAPAQLTLATSAIYSEA